MTDLRKYPALFLCDLDGNAEGIVYHFCDDDCRNEFKHDIEKFFAATYKLCEGSSSDAVSQTHCDNCNADLGVSQMTRSASLIRTLLAIGLATIGTILASLLFIALTR